jgi:hypothetical protein
MRRTVSLFPHHTIPKTKTSIKHKQDSRIQQHTINSRTSTKSCQLSTDTVPDHIHLLPSIFSPTTSYPIAGMNRSPVAHRLPSVKFAINRPLKPRIPILVPYECKCQCKKVCNINGDHPFHCQKKHKTQRSPTQHDYQQILSSSCISTHTHYSKHHFSKSYLDK